ncbi:hypothetical protein F5Y00DRAFT_260916 [Daldinia vernicosa]|uniref:uncharacterized protein n=1 Tax=Daldinia vernicosa TaxID=114800 RepID=UPI002008069B|nr:uncharacterized protein F5Y00DRAFT_260916 [Daldinia vernicosa]KAI0850187.1 hypothetical protein F5Y00DRAFT_260916 [Daldinia vernicosa]
MLTSLAIPTSCVTDVWVTSTGTRTGVFLGNPFDSSCWPGKRDLATTISPAFCPVGYSSACNASPSNDDSETVWACCPTGFTCDGGFYSCLSGGRTSKTYIVTYTDRAENTLTSQLVTDSGVNAHSIRVAFHSSDVFATATPTPTSSSASSPIPTSTSPSNSDDSDSEGISAGAKVGIGIGVGLGGLILFLVLGWLAWRRYRNKVAPGQYQTHPGTPAAKMSVVANASGIHELGTGAYAELPAEIPASSPDRRG